MAQFAGDAQRLDPYKNFTLRLWDGHHTYSGNRRTGLLPPAEVVKHRAGGDPSTSHKSPGRNKYEGITLDRGVTQDSGFSAWAGQSSAGSKYEPVALNRGVFQDQAFNTWASKVWNFGSAQGSEASLANFRKDIYLEFYDEAGQLVVRYKIYGLSVSETAALPPGGVLQHFLQPRGPMSIQEQLAAIFQNSLKRLRP